jgi:hypothetical protein
MNFIEIIDPRGNSYKFKTEMTLNGQQELMLPRVKNSEGKYFLYFIHNIGIVFKLKIFIKKF